MLIFNLKNKNIILNNKKILKNVNFSIEKKDFVLFSGDSGSGKTTLINYLTDNYPHLVGRVFQETDQQFTMESPFLELIFLLENIRFPTQKMGKKAKDILKEFHLLNQKDQPVNTLSGGEQQRLALAEASNLNSDLIILDEPFANVDSKNINFLLQKIISLQKKGKTFIIADHNPLLYENLVNKIFTFKNQQVKELNKSQFSNFFNSFRFNYHFLIRKSLPTQETNSINISKLQINFGKKEIFKNAEAKISKSDNLLLLGENGSGKTTLLKAIAGLQKYQGKIKKRGKLILAFQNASETFLKVTVKEEINLSNAKSFNHFLKEKDIEYWLKELNLNFLLSSSVYTLSGGEKKKLQILLIAIQSPDIILLDESFAGLDKNSILKIISLLKTIPSTKIFISHQLFGLDQIINNVYTIEDKQLIKLKRI